MSNSNKGAIKQQDLTAELDATFAAFHQKVMISLYEYRYTGRKMKSRKAYSAMLSPTWL